jgi:hypothetical protein
MKENHKSSTHKEPVNKEAFHLLAVEIGLNEACRKLGVPIPTGKSWARRGGWKLPKRSGGRPGRALAASSASSLHPIADALAQSHKELATRARTALAQATVAAAEQAAADPALPVKSTSHLRDLVAGASRLFGWEAKNQQGDTFNTLVITRAQLQEIRDARAQMLREQSDVQGDEEI